MLLAIYFIYLALLNYGLYVVVKEYFEEDK